jgi:trimethylamine--corrinoid protein Co-methyltransferase
VVEASTTKVSSKGQVVIPVNVRKATDLRKGEKILALELIKEVGPAGDGYMASDFNMSRIDTFYKTFSMDTRAFDVWLNEGAQLWTHDLCREKLKELEKHEPVPLPKDVAERMDAITKEGIELLKRR